MNKNNFIKLIQNMNEDEFDIFRNIIQEDVCLKREDIISEFEYEVGNEVLDIVEKVIDILEEV